MLKCLFIKIKRKYQKPREKHTKILANLFYGYSLILLLLWIRAIVWGHSRPKSAVLNVELTDAYEFGVFYTKARTRTHTHSTHKECVRERAKREREWKTHAAAWRECVRAEATKKVNVAFSVSPPEQSLQWTKLSLDQDWSQIVPSHSLRMLNEERAPRDVRWVPDEVNEM